MAGWLGHMRHWLTQIGEQDCTLEALGPQSEPVEVREAVHRLHSRMDDALRSEYLDRVRERLQQEDAVSNIHWTNLVFELKRCLILASLLRSVPRISPAVDKMWRAMQLQPKDYKTFESQFMPVNDAAGKRPDPDSAGRAFFDAAYVSLFEATPFSQKVWCHFLRYPLSIDVIRRCREERDALIDDVFSPSCRDDKVLRSLAEVVVGGVSQAEAEVREHVKALGPDPKMFRERYDVKPETMWRDRALLLRMIVFHSLLPYFQGGAGGQRPGHPVSNHPFSDIWVVFDGNAAWNLGPPPK